MRSTRRGFTLIELLIVIAVIGILAAIAIPNLIMAIQRAKQKRTMADMRDIAQAWEARANDASGYSAAGFFGASTLLGATSLAGVLEPTYIKSMPRVDGWGHAYRFYLDQPLGAVHHATTYVIHSAGNDGTFDDATAAGVMGGFDCDIVYSNGTFVTYPSR